MGAFDDLIPGGKKPAKGGMFDDLIPDATKPRNFAAVANDTVIELANAAAGGVKSAADFVRPGNALSSFIDENIIKVGEANQSAAVKAEKARYAGEMASAQGIGDEIGATLGYIGRNPLQALAQAAGSFVLPGAAVKGAGMLGSVARLGGKGVANAGLAGGAVAGAALSGGDAAGTAYDLVKRAGGTDREATEAARKASVLPAAIGAAGGVIGAERLLAGASGFKGGQVSRALKTAGVEGAQEAVEEGVTQYEGQRAAMPFDPSIDPMKGVAGAATMGAALGAATGGGLSLLSGAPAPIIDPVNPVLAAPNLDAALNAFQAAVTTPRATGLPKVPSDQVGVPITAFGDRVRNVQEQLADPDTRARIRHSLGDAAFNEIAYYATTADNMGVDLPDVTRERMIGLAESLIERGLFTREFRPGIGSDASAPAGLLGNTSVPRIGLDTTLTGTLRADSAGSIAPETEADAISTRQAVSSAAQAAARPGDDVQARKVGSAWVENLPPAPPAIPGPVTKIEGEVLDEYGNVIGPGLPSRSTELAVIQPGEIQPGDIMAKNGEPFGSKTSAQAKAYALGGGEIVPLPDHFGLGQVGFVVRPALGYTPATPATTERPALPAPAAPAPDATPAAIKPAEGLPTRTYLDVPFRSKDFVKKAGAKWDADRKLWFTEPIATGMAKGEININLQRYIPEKLTGRPEENYYAKSTAQAIAANATLATGVPHEPVKTKTPSGVNAWSVLPVEQAESAQKPATPPSAQALSTSGEPVQKKPETAQVEPTHLDIHGNKATVPFDQLTAASVVETASGLSQRRHPKTQDPRVDQVAAQQQYLLTFATEHPQEAAKIAQEIAANVQKFSDASGTSPDRVRSYGRSIERTLESLKELESLKAQAASKPLSSAGQETPPAERDWQSATPEQIEGEIDRLTAQHRQLHQRQGAIPGAESPERMAVLRQMDEIDRQRASLEKLLPDEEQDSAAEDDTLEPKFGEPGYEAPKNWRTSWLNARQYAKDIGIPYEGGYANLELDKLVKLIDQTVGKPLTKTAKAVKAKPLSPEVLAEREQTASTVQSIFEGLASADKRKRSKAATAMKSHALAERMAEVESGYLDMLERLNDSGRIKINC